MVLNYLKSNTSNHFLVILSIIILSGLLRFYGLTNSGYWLDELAIANISNPDNDLNNLLLQVRNDTHPPGYHLLLWLTYKTIGYNELSGRFLSALSGVLTVIMIYYFSKRIHSNKVALYAVIVSTTSSFLIYHSNEVRPYVMLGLFSILSYYIFLELLKNYSTYNILTLAFINSIIFYIHYFGITIIISQLTIIVMLYFFHNYIDKRNFYISLIPYILFGLLSINNLFWLLEDVIILAPRGQFKLSTFYSVVINNFGGFWWTFYIFILFFFLGLYSLSKKGNLIQIYVLINWIIITLIIPLIYSIFITNVIQERYLIMSLPPMIIVYSIGIDSIKYNKVKTIILLMILLIPIYYVILIQKYYHSEYTKSHFKNVVVYYINNNNNERVFSHYFNELNVYFNWENSFIKAEDDDDLDNILPNIKRFWFLDGHDFTGIRPLISSNKFIAVNKLILPTALAVLLEKKE